MIDYEKLKECHKLCEKYARQNEYSIYMEMRFTYCGTVEYELSEDNTCLFSNLDDLLKKLHELTKTEPKYKQGDIVWMVYQNEPCDFIIIHNVGKKYSLDSYDTGLVNESELYPSKADLIQAQIEYWQNLRREHKAKSIEDFENSCRKNDEISTRSENISMPYANEDTDYHAPKECQHVSQTPKSTSKTHTCVKCFEEYFRECEHEPDPKCFTQVTNGVVAKCIKCGKFYE